MGKEMNEDLEEVKEELEGEREIDPFRAVSINKKSSSFAKSLFFPYLSPHHSTNHAARWQ